MLSRYTVPVEFRSGKYAGRVKTITIVYTVSAENKERASAVAHSMAGRWVGQTVKTSERFQTPKRTTQFIDVRSIRVLSDLIELCQKDDDDDCNALGASYDGRACSDEEASDD
jgi:hypothetical protein